MVCSAGGFGCRPDPGFGNRPSFKKEIAARRDRCRGGPQHRESGTIKSAWPRRSCYQSAARKSALPPQTGTRLSHGFAKDTVRHDSTQDWCPAEAHSRKGCLTRSHRLPDNFERASLLRLLRLLRLLLLLLLTLFTECTQQLLHGVLLLLLW